MKAIPDSRRKKVFVSLTGAAVIAMTETGVVAAIAGDGSGISYVGRVGSATSAGSSASASMVVSREVRAGDALLVTVVLRSSSSLSGPVTVFDNAGNVYAANVDQNDGEGGNRLLVLAARRVRALTAGGTMTMTFPKSAECQVSVDEFAGVGTIDQRSSYSRTEASSSSRSIATTQAGELVFGVMGNGSGVVSNWAAGWTVLPPASGDRRLLSTAFQVSNAPDSFGASGLITGTGLAAIVAYAPEPASHLAKSAVATESNPPLDTTVDTMDSPAGSLTGKDNAAPAVTATTSQIAVYAGYYDTHHKSNIKPKPSPWKGSSGVVFVGHSDSGGGWDTSAIRVDNLTSGSLSGVVVTVDIASHHYALWGTNTIPAGGRLILAQTSGDNFDGSDTNRAGCYGCSSSLCKNAVSSTIPVVHVTFGGKTTNYSDTGQVLNTHGVDSAGCPYTGTRNDESQSWHLLGG